MTVLRFALKTSVAGGVIYLTVREGLWSNAEDTAKLYRKIYNNIAPVVSENVPKEVINEISDLPSTTDISDMIKHSWNKGIMVSCKFISELPKHTSNGINSILEIPAVKDVINSFKSDSGTDRPQ